MLSRPRSSLDATVMRLVLIFLVIIGAALTWIYLAGGTPEPFSAATAPPKTQAALPRTAGTQAAGAGVATGAAQTFTIVPAESQAVYKVGETLFRENNRFNLAIGTTTAINGGVVIDRAQPRNSRIGTITIDISQLRSDSDRRDNAIRDRWLESRRFPNATFTPTAIEGLPQTYTDGQALSLRVRGNLKIRDVTRMTTFAVTLRLQGNVLRGTATTALKMADFGFDPPSILGILRAQNDVQVELQFTARPGQ